MFTRRRAAILHKYILASHRIHALSHRASKRTKQSFAVLNSKGTWTIEQRFSHLVVLLILIDRAPMQCYLCYFSDAPVPISRATFN